MRKNRYTGIVGVCTVVLALLCQQRADLLAQDKEPETKYPLTADSLPNPENPHGEFQNFDYSSSKIFPYTHRTISVYVPAQYRPETPACVYVALDGLDFHVGDVFDNLIAKHEMPVTIAIGISSGTVDSKNKESNPRFDRSMEFDSQNDRLAHFIVEEIFPLVEQHTTKDGRRIVLSRSGNDHLIAGASTGAIAAFTVAWTNPEAFSRVFTAIGTFVGMRGGEEYYVLVRKTEPKPIRIFMQDGIHDEWEGGPEMGDWWMSNQTMARALEFAGYDVRHVWGTGSHNGSQASAIFPDAMRWLWRDWPAAIPAGAPGNPVLKEILLPGEGWKVALQGCTSPVQLAANADGQVFYRTGDSQDIAGIASAGEARQCDDAETAMPFLLSPAGRLYLARADGGITVTNLSKGHETGTKVLAKDLHVHGLTLASDGALWVTAETAGRLSGLWRIAPDGQQVQLDRGLKGASGIAFLPDELWLLVAQSGSKSGLSYRVDPGGKLSAREPLYAFAALPSDDDSEAESVAMDREGKAYVATRLGVQVFDRNGRVTAILPVPGNVPVNSVCFGGEDFSTLYAVAGDEKVYKRRLAVKGFLPGTAPKKLPPWGAG